MKTNEKMEILSVEELEKVLGGYDDAGCRRVQAEAIKKATNEDSDWEQWTEKFYRYCV